MPAPLNEAEYIIMGKAGAPHGIRGWIKIRSFTTEIDGILDFSPWYLAFEDGWRPVELEESRLHGKGIAVKLKGYDTPEQARVLTGKDISVLRSQLPPTEDNEYYWTDLEGLTVIDQTGKTLGIVMTLMETGANDVLIIRDSQNKQHAVPWLPKTVITDVNLADKTIHVNWELI